MGKKKVLILLMFLLCFLFNQVSSVHAVEPLDIKLTPMACQGNICPDIMRDRVYSQLNPPETCAASYDDFLTSPNTKHFWAEDPVVTAQGKADERARQFIYWVLNKNSIDNHPVINAIWKTTSGMAFIFMILVVAIMAMGFIVAQRANFELNIKIWPFVSKIFLSLLYIFFSWLIVVSLIKISEWLMKLFIDNLGGNNLFNVYFNSATGSSEKNYTDFIGCRDLNIRVQESADAEMLIFKITNFTYYAMGVMLILRKILLWFMIFISPFLALLFPFVFIRNVGWVWIGVFFQWLLYGPLFALFLGALNQMWKAGIPFAFNFSRVNDISGYIYPTALILTYGGPAQRGAQAIGALNNGNYVDTFVEYVITLIMLWAVILFPWLLLRTFRDYCCDGIYAMKNILLSMYDQMRGGTPQSPTPPSFPNLPGLTNNLKMQMPKEVTVPIKVKIETLEEIKKTRTEDITKSMNLSASKITDIARFETNKSVQENMSKNLNYLSNPAQADTPAERQKYMNIRTELFNRAIKQDTIAKQILSATSSSSVERIQKREELLKTTPQATPISTVVSVKVQLPKEKVASVNNTVVNSITNNNNVVNSIAQSTNVPTPQVHTILTSFKTQTTQLSSNTIANIASQTGIEKEKVAAVVKHISHVVKSNKDLAKEIAQKENIEEGKLQQIVDTQIPAVTEPEKHVEDTISMPSTVSIEDYEEVKKMWISQYEKGEVPVSENVQSRQDWIEEDIVFITNTLNKLLSTDENQRREGLDEVGYILPIFIINNLKGEELMVYLKAKLEAAKSVLENINREKEITEKVKAAAEAGKEELVDLAPSKPAEAAKEMHMEEEMEVPGEKKEDVQPPPPTTPSEEPPKNNDGTSGTNTT
jgi:hypothetical protein